MPLFLHQMLLYSALSALSLLSVCYSFNSQKQISIFSRTSLIILFSYTNSWGIHAMDGIP
ncbi:hypothetical protein MANES_04G035034v8 [Manihot esculenta]|uniref:Uncharacterized protein n=1 Tax=Manihot esculenta TaxID=3983 RepID=A0ACB7HTC7_MANES|nr:hypothetical protein MANES_04G035034v8 [Manihot esculenta]